jgi:hypothetical protein
MKLLIGIFILSISFSTFSQTYVAVSASSLSQLDTTEEGAANSDLLLKGTGIGAYVGHRFNFVALEGFYKSNSTSTESGVIEFDLDDTVIGFGLRLHFLTYLNFKFGIMKHDAKGELKVSGTTLLEYNSEESGSYYGLGFQIPVSSFEIFADAQVWVTNDEETSSAGVAFQEVELGLSY